MHDGYTGLLTVSLTSPQQRTLTSFLERISVGIIYLSMEIKQGHASAMDSMVLHDLNAKRETVNAMFFLISFSCSVLFKFGSFDDISTIQLVLRFLIFHGMHSFLIINTFHNVQPFHEKGFRTSQVQQCGLHAYV